jgi:hypothetical protein
MSATRFLYKKTMKRRYIGYDDLIFPLNAAEVSGRAKSR